MLIFVVLPGAALPVAALEKTSARVRDPDFSDWSNGNTCAISYYNTCTGWSWIWSAWHPGDLAGVFFERCCKQAILEESLHLLTGSNNYGYGGTGTISVMASDSAGNAVGPPIESHYIYTLNYDTVWHPVQWGVSVPEYFLLQMSWTYDGSSDRYWSDHPAAGPTGPPAVGVCYPSTRAPHTLGSRGGSPWQPLNDGTGNVEFMWVANLVCPVHVEDRSWGSIKALYR
jgi:hypothetical protein